MRTSRQGKIAILVPSFNGGALLAETVLSAGRAGMPPGSYEIVVSDNGSTDGSLITLPPTDEQGASITLQQNDRNLGRVANWNCALEHAREMGFSYANFQMVGDLVKDASLILLRDKMVRHGASLGIASYEITDQTLRTIRVARRIVWRDDKDEGLKAEDFLAQSLATGAMLCGPLCANLYQIEGPARLAFDPSDASHTDQLATALFLLKGPGGIVYLDKPVARWRARPDRFHGTMLPAARLQGDLRVIGRACEAGRIPLDFRKIRASLLLRAFFHTQGNLRKAWFQAQKAANGAPLSWAWLATLIYRQLRHKTPWLITA
jgi:glycosyltransferase involved in cell wall biosynthesis